MQSQIIISTLAAKELQESFDWYENLSKGLGFRFVEFVDKVFGIIEYYPESFPKKKGSLREASVKRFPYLIIYEYSPKADTAYILHIFNSHQSTRKKHSRKR
ncbi:MAG: type II toxin-antitoxin system RelE/ParE family toxin [Bacteroidia bacterium]|jgi:ParE toxin of type II toxin-antitoxin system, parDE